MECNGVPCQTMPTEERNEKETTAPEHTVLIDIHTDLLSSISERLGTVASKYKEGDFFTIFRVPAHIREANRGLYEPRMVSIGPYHRGAGRLRAMEEYKWRCLHGMVCNTPAHGLEDYITKAKELEARARNCYTYTESFAIGSGEFAEMLLLDSCFIIQFLLKSYYKQHDALCEVSWNRELVRSDLLLLENQIPFFVLQAFFDLLGSTDFAWPSLTNLAIGFLSQSRYDCPITNSGREVYHLLHLYHSCLIPAPSHVKCNPRSSSPASLLGCWRRSSQSSRLRSPKTIPCVTKLRICGVAFKRKDSSSFLDITFRDGTIEIPHLSIEDSTRSLFVNLVAFEQCFPRFGQSLTSYAVFMNCLISTPRDVGILQRYGIIENRLASLMDAADFFNQLCDCAYLGVEDHCLMGLFQDVRDYCESDWPRWRARLMHEYFSNPWAILSIAAALILLGLTVAQTVFAALSYFYPPT